jgi:hypothetical protein
MEGTYSFLPFFLQSGQVSFDLQVSASTPTLSSAATFRSGPVTHLESHIYDNPNPHVHRRHGYRPGFVPLRSGDVLALFVLAELLKRERDYLCLAFSRFGAVVGKSMVDMFGCLRFGQPSLLRLRNGEFLASHLGIEEGQGRIRTHRLRVDLY